MTLTDYGSSCLAMCLLTMALAACMDGAIRMTADLMEIELDRIRVEVVNCGEATGETEDRLVKLRSAAEASSGVLNMLRGQMAVDVSWS